jgi:hypothetical protein
MDIIINLIINLLTLGGVGFLAYQNKKTVEDISSLKAQISALSLKKSRTIGFQK